MKLVFFPMFVLALALSLAGCGTSGGELAPLSSVRPGVAAEGSLANAPLTKDATAAIRKLAGGNKAIVKFVIQQPVGEPGKKAWREIWTYDIEGASKRFIMTFREDGQGSAAFEIQRM